MLWLYRFFKGYLKIKIFGEFPERLINKCVKNGLFLWNIKYSKNEIFFKISLKDFYRLSKIRKGLKIKIHIVSKIGMPFIIKRYKNRYGIFLGLILFFISLYILSGYIWCIKIEGNNYLKKEQIIRECKNIGVEIGTKKSAINSKICAEKLLLNNNSLAWASFNIEGSVVTVNITEIKKSGEIDAKTPTNLKAKHDGIITKVDVTVGNCIVKVGQKIVKDELLVSGIMEGVSTTEFVHSLGKIYAKTNRTFSSTKSFVQQKKINNKEKFSRKAISFFGFHLPLYLQKNDEKFKMVTYDKKYLFGKKIPIVLYKKDYVGFNEKTIKYSKEELENFAQNDINKQIIDENIKDYEVLSREIIVDEKELTLTVTITTEENIAYQDILLFNSAN